MISRHLFFMPSKYIPIVNMAQYFTSVKHLLPANNNDTIKEESRSLI